MTLPAEDKIMAALESRLTAESVAHSLSTAEMAELLATIYGADVGKARIAGLLHDWDKDLAPEEILADAAAMGIDAVDAEREAPYLLHAKTGALRIEAAFPGLDDEIVSAVRSHTTGSEYMSDLDKIVYTADMIEVLRDFDGVDALREAAGNVSLDDLFSLCYTHSLKHVLDSRKKIHPDAVAVWNAQVGGRS